MVNILIQEIKYTYIIINICLHVQSVEHFVDIRP